MGNFSKGRIPGRSHMRALIVAMALGAILVPALVWVNNQKTEHATTGFGYTAEFAYPFDNKAGGLTNFDLENQVAVVGVAQPGCSGECLGALVESLKRIQQWSDAHLAGRNETYILPVRFYVMAEDLPEVPKEWGTFKLSYKIMPLLPDLKENFRSEPALIAVVDNTGFFRTIVAPGETESNEAVQRELSKIIAHSSLVNYVAEQTLMWEKARGRAK
jgi:hypothetical protein